jgi:hypothetical protein
MQPAEKEPFWVSSTASCGKRGVRFHPAVSIFEHGDAKQFRHTARSQASNGETALIADHYFCLDRDCPGNGK